MRARLRSLARQLVWVQVCCLAACTVPSGLKRSTEPFPDLASTQLYSTKGIVFTYPGNWQIVAEDETPGKLRHVAVKSKQGSVVVIQRYEPKSEWSLAEFADWFDTRAKQATDRRPLVGAGGDVTDVPVHATISGRQVKGLRRGFWVSFLGMRVSIDRAVYKIDLPEATVFLVAQTKTDDWNLALPAFNLIFSSLELE